MYLYLNLVLFFKNYFFSSQYCPFDFYKSESYISVPLLSALNSGHLKPGVFQPLNSEIESRSLYLNGNPNENSPELESSIRFASLGLAAKNIFQDMVVRRVVGFTRLLKLASNIWDSWKSTSPKKKKKIRTQLKLYSNFISRDSSNT